MGWGLQGWDGVCKDGMGCVRMGWGPRMRLEHEVESLLLPVSPLYTRTRNFVVAATCGQLAGTTSR